ncbi:RHS repeat domain-containing protein [Aquimarina mytili]|uniref:RHS repeat-associated core domain-containing protein n=1 Tax=Aquimarina mytili TaxID=874423 RepID=A0A937DD79_9FLAO|nr:RHS repeat-associated core domain-containing protein [Aquimarina mytili]MBL0685736.1 hypothetical protein [Aquimarina mytili]
MTQDANLKAQGKWLFTKYDAFGRVTYTGVIQNNSERVAMQDSANNTTVYTQYETKQSTANAIAGTTIYYSNDAIPQGITEIHTINYYDDYTFDRPGISAPPLVLGQTVDVNAKGLPTGSKIRVLGTNQWITTGTFYDQKGRAIYVSSTNDYLNTADIIETKLDFVGKVEKTKTTHTKGSNAAIVTIDTFEYDHMGRLLTQTQKINDQPEEVIVANTYDELGQLQSKIVGGGLQNVDYSYNIRGWLKGINDVTQLGNDLFGFAIDYNSGISPLYNGNISRTSWQTANDNTKRWYNYEYDALNRIENAIGNSGNFTVSNISYDKVGNILSLDRQGLINTTTNTFGAMDKLSYHYDSGNKLLSVTDTANKDYGFKEGTNTNDDFEYDANGNMIIDRNKGITGITYNHLNLPEIVAISNSKGTGNITYIYDATGAKLKKIAPSGGSFIETEYAGNYVYKNGNLEFFNHPEGIVEKEADGYKYVYQFKDHLGNVRLSYKDADKNGSISQSEIVQEKNYYPFGLTHKGYNSAVNGRNHNYGFGGVEEQDELGLEWLDITARNYDPAIGRWMNLDPLAESMRRHSPYNFAFDNPVFFLDPDGMMPCPNGDCGSAGDAVPISSGQSLRIAVVRKAKSLWNSFTTIASRSASQNVAAALTSISSNENLGNGVRAASNGDVAGVANAVSESVNSSIDQIAAEEGLSRANAVSVMGAGVAIDVATTVATDGMVSSVTKGTNIVSKADDLVSTSKNTGKVVSKPNITAPYKRPSNATTPSMRKHVNEVGKETGCAKCGTKTDKYIAGHKKALVEEYYETGTIDQTNMRSNSAIQPECSTCSNQEGAAMSKFSKQKKKEHGFN